MEESPFLRQVASYFFPTGSNTPRFFKQLLGDKILQATGIEDMKAILDLAIVSAYRRFKSKGGTDLITWLSWMIPYECSKWVSWREQGPVLQDEEISLDIEEFESRDIDEERISVLCDEVGLCKQSKYYWLRRV